MYQILPQLELAALYQSPVDTTIYQKPVPTYYCPTRRTPNIYGSAAKSDYAGNGGDGQTAYNGSITRRSGQKHLTFDTMSDGTSNTLLIGEKQTNVKNFGGSGGDNEPWVNSGWDEDQIRNGNPSNAPAHDSNHPVEPPSFWSQRFGSSHSGGFNGLMVDGAVRSIPYNIDVETFRRICVRNDGLTVGEF